MSQLTAYDTLTATTVAVIEQFGEALNRHDLAGLSALLTADSVFENTYPTPDGTRLEGREAICATWADLFQSSPHGTFETEEVFACGERGVIRSVYRWIDDAGTPGHVRGVSIVRVRDGQVVESLAYVKG